MTEASTRRVRGGWLPRAMAPACMHRASSAPPHQAATTMPLPALLAATAKWAAADRYLSAATCVAGAALLLLSTLFLFSLTEREGQLLGLVLMASGAAGYLGGRRKSSAAVQLQLVGCLVGVLLGFGLINEVSGKGAWGTGGFYNVSDAVCQLYAPVWDTVVARLSLLASPLPPAQPAHPLRWCATARWTAPWRSSTSAAKPPRRP